jgi:hypothetical protein
VRVSVIMPYAEFISMKELALYKEILSIEKGV